MRISNITVAFLFTCFGIATGISYEKNSNSPNVPILLQASAADGAVIKHLGHNLWAVQDKIATCVTTPTLTFLKCSKE